jgi:hypothetical protein
MSPYLPFSARVCLNQHHWLAKRMVSEGIGFRQCSNAFLKCSDQGKPQLRDKLATICDNYLTVQQDILETFVDPRAIA